MDTSNSAGRLIAALREQLRTKGWHYRDVASRLKISERTVKRYFSGRGITLDVLQRLADVVDLDVLSLVALAQDEGTEYPEMTRAQQAELRKNKIALPVLFFLHFGMAPAQIAQELELDGGQLESILSRLETWGLIRRFSKNRVKILAAQRFGSRGGDQLTEHKLGSVRRLLSEIDVANPNCKWFYEVVRVSRTSALRLEQLIKQFMFDAAAITKSELDLPASETQWFRLLLAAEPTPRRKLIPKS
jgi:transcriptional regulator with XRE-family HTH domain